MTKRSVFSSLAVFMFSTVSICTAQADSGSSQIILKSESPSLPHYRNVVDKGIISKDSAWFWEDPAGNRGPKVPYEPAEEGYRMVNGKSHPLQGSHHQHWLIYQNNRIHVGDRPIINIRVIGGSFMYGTYDSFPITGIGLKDAVQNSTDSFSLGAARLAVYCGSKTKWLDEFEHIETTYKAGFAEWICRDESLGAKIKIQTRPNISARGFICKIQVQEAQPGTKLAAFYGLVGFSKWPYSNFIYSTGTSTSNPPNKYRFINDGVLVTSEALPRAQSYFGITGTCQTSLAPENIFDIDNPAAKPIYDQNSNNMRQCAKFTTEIAGGQELYAISVWGADKYDKAKAQEVRSRLSSDALEEPFNNQIWLTWYDNFIGMQLEPETKFARLKTDPKKAWDEAEQFWIDRSERWHIETPNKSLNATANWTGQTLEYFRQPPGYMLAQLMWCGYGHITSGWGALGVMGDTENLRTLLAMHAATRQNPTVAGGDPKNGAGNKEIRWTFLNLETTVSEPLNAPFVDHVWMCWQWSGDKQWLKALWPAVRDAIHGEMAARDPDGDGLYHGFYEFWDCDIEQRGPKAAAETAWMISGLKNAATMARAIGLFDEAEFYDAQSKKSYDAFQKQLWYSEIGQAGGRGADDQRYERASIHENFIGAQRGVLDQKQAAQAFRRLNYLYSQKSRWGLPLFFKNDVWPIIWSQHYMAPGDTSLTYMAAAKCGLADEFFPYMEVIAAAPLKSYHAGMGLSIGQDGATDSMQNANSDAQAPFAWAIAEGLFGVAPDGEPNRVLISPSIPSNWPRASARFGGICIDIINSEKKVNLIIADRQKRTLRIQWPTRREVKAVRSNGRKIDYKLQEAVNRALLEIVIKADNKLDLALEFGNEVLSISGPSEVIKNKKFELTVANGKAALIDDPQKCFSAQRIAKNRVELNPVVSGFHTIFVKVENKSLAYWAPVSFDVGPSFRIVEEYVAPDPPRKGVIKQVWPRMSTRMLPSFAVPQQNELSVKLLNRSATDINSTAKVAIGGESYIQPVRCGPGKYAEVNIILSSKSWNNLLPGKTDFTVEINGVQETSHIYLWPDEQGKNAPTVPDEARQMQLDLSAAKKLTAAEMKKVTVKQDFGGMDTLLGWYHPAFELKALPKKFEAFPGLIFTGSGITEPNASEPMIILARTVEPNLPTSCTIPVNSNIERAYALVVLDYYPIKAYAPQAEWVLNYSDGTKDITQLIPPYNVDSMRRPESPGSFHVKNIGKFANEMAESADHFIGPFHAQVFDIKADSSKKLGSIEARITSTESFMGVIGVTLIKAAEMPQNH